MSLEIRPIKLKDANAYVGQHHRHNMPTNGHKWSLAVYDGERLCGVAIAGQPVARNLDDGLTIEIRRVCTDGTFNACSKLYGACARVAKEMGYRRVVTYTLETESGASLRASGYTNAGGLAAVHGTEKTDPANYSKKRFSASKRNTPNAKKSDGKKPFKGEQDNGEE